MNFPQNKYQIILADPPWKQSRGGKKSVRSQSSGKPLVYPTLGLNEIETHLRLARDLSANNHIMFLWTIEKYLRQAEDILGKLSYKLHARMIWNKVTGIPAAFTIRFGHEYLLYAYYGKLLPVEKTQRGKWHSVLTEQVQKHSMKPEIAYQFIESVYPTTRKIELYARKQRDGWDALGDEIDGMDMRDSLELLGEYFKSIE